MSKLFLALSFILLARCNIVPGWPDAIRCGGDNTNVAAATFFLVVVLGINFIIIISQLALKTVGLIFIQ